MQRLTWPLEAPRPAAPDDPALCQPGSNICLDLHGDPLTAKLVVFSDGNHHMALGECIGAFVAENPQVGDVFYATTPPGLLVDALHRKILRVGNLALSIVPDVFIGPREIIDRLAARRLVNDHGTLAKSRGNVLLIRHGNPKNIQGISDLLRNDLRVALSNPESEKASFRVYADTLTGLAAEAGLDVAAYEKRFTGAGDDHVVYSTVIHHRELPQLLADGRADVAMVYYHLALRYQRIFPDIFDFIPLGGTKDDPEPGPAQHITHYGLGLVGDGGHWGGKFVDYILGNAGAEIYRRHGLSPVRGGND
ncbi:MAG: substrate-binding domain-containing protein [Gammaproteobacteria bacterium]|nr:substrate-binding domain-containing protein [Gammaproteobacteria bacterium]